MHEEDLKEESNTSRKEISGKWIQRLKEESWEAELLISAIAIFGTFQLFGFIGWATNKFIDYLDPSQYSIAYMITYMGLMAVSILATMFVIHFFLRAYWVGLVGLNSVFSDYSIQDSLYSEIYTKNLLSTLPKLKDTIQLVDELCSVIFSAAFSFILTYFYIALIASGYLLLYNLISDYVAKVILFIPVVLILTVIVLQAILEIVGNTRKFKQHENLQLLLFRISKVVYIVIHGPLYKYLLQITMIFVSNFKKNKSLVVLILSFLAIGIGVAAFKQSDTNIPYLMDQSEYFDEAKVYPSYYKTENENRDYLLSPELDSDVIEAGVIKIFIPTYKHEARIQQEVCGTFESEDEKSESKLEKTFELNCYHQYHQVLLDDQPLNIQFLTSRHPQTKQWGIVGYIDTRGLEVGNHALTVKKTKGEQVFSEWTIPFYYLGYGQRN